ncbi:MAG: hypothetical protein UR25_C0003G0145 [Candidatus Nomurabacteria bacterium GW2011_GWE1_32_28]|uniref:Uncharacterized protein n=1 Tax=Candidatus Nomurabacteria bacterium GW2011_GWF1_31_48 TaxID=1618767 RepID=A0A0G0BH33_9BACT|nr:MAG: hypothetical protein UR10_C0003G0144 [Candidatus Nomurabacteria bacterium GW2011_GWF2_30_133]KKP28784.1 MAG: hypothetical protein UR18_C0002G0196 [Candidatus Nomurabacteria bacterium GW2011_GWE2_31_40]KKP30362.1 MAG: hypothetical protein UR19_C0003G0198 [Candidatus Nomurabacteria bacterium GW2011_GWF1_31_48]KKP34889.1 MAG: hypothetical protein UR25_C0003G0145 [Candidatus Nomurabacteria bacterium GW2011_GWE1_32_28]
MSYDDEEELTMDDEILDDEESLDLPKEPLEDEEDYDPENRYH